MKHAKISIELLVDADWITMDNLTVEEYATLVKQDLENYKQVVAVRAQIVPLKNSTSEAR